VNKAQILDFLGLLGAKPAADQNRAGWVIGQCPLGPWKHDNGKSNNQAFGVKLEPGDGFCSCFSCGFHGVQSHLLLELQRLNKTAKLATLQLGEAFELVVAAENNVELDFGGPGIEETLFAPKTGDDHHVYPEDWLASFASAWSVAWSRSYLQWRGVSFLTATTLDLRVDTKLHRVCCPIRDFKGRLRGLHGRAVDDTAQPRYWMYKHAGKKNPLIWLGESWVDISKPIVVVEGYFDLASVLRVYGNVVSPLFVNPSQAKILRMADAMEWITVLDQGKGGLVGRVKINKVLPGHAVTHLQPTAKDPGAMTVPELRLLLENHVELDQ
jgi:hypothetical protein